MYQQDQLQFQLLWFKFKVAQKRLCHRGRFAWQQPTSQSHQPAWCNYFEPGKEEPLLLGWSRLGMMNACPSKEVFSCCSGLHWISSVVGFLPSLLRIWPGTRVSIPTQRSTFASPFQQSRLPLTKQNSQLFIHVCIVVNAGTNTKLQLEYNYLHLPSKPYK